MQVNYQDYKSYAVRSASILTNSYVAGTVLGGGEYNTQNQNQLLLAIDFTIGALTTAEIKVEFSLDGTTYYQETSSAISGGISSETLLEHQLSASGKYMLAIPIKYPYVKVSAKGTGVLTNSSMKIDAIIGTV